MSAEPLSLPWGRRVAVAVFAGATVALVMEQSSRIFTKDHDVLPSIGAVAAAAVLALVMSSAPALVRAVTILVAATCGAAAAIMAVGGELPADLVRAPAHGINDLVSAVWPSPPIAAGVGALVLLGGIAAGLAVDLAIRRNPVSALLPSLAMIGCVAMLSAPAGPPPTWSLAAYAVATLGVLGARTFAYRSSITTLSAAVVVVVAIGVPVVFGGQLEAERFDPRLAVTPPATPQGGISPLARLDEWRSRTPAEVVFATSSPTPARWRLVGLTRYDGRTWLPADDYRRAGSELAVEDTGLPVVSVSVSVGSLDAAWLPTFDRTLSVSRAVRVDDGRSGLLADEPPASGTSYDLRIQPSAVGPAQLANAQMADATARPFSDGFVPSPQIAELATSITAGARTDYERAEAIASYLRDDFVLDVDSPPGHSIAVLDLFIDRSRRGRDEQFVATYALLAATIGLPVRVAVGFETVTNPDSAAGIGATIARSDRAIAWPEVEFVDFGWVAFDPVPSTTNTGAPALGDGAIAPTDEQTDEEPPTTAATTTQTTLPDTSDDDIAVADPSSAVSGTAVGVAIGMIGAALGALAYLGMVVWLKARKRRRRRTAPDPRDRAVGAFISSIEVMIDLGLPAPRAATNSELVQRGAVAVGESAKILMPVAALATEALYSTATVSTERADDAWSSTERFEHEAAERMGRIRAIRAKASLRSLRRGWR